MTARREGRNLPWPCLPGYSMADEDFIRARSWNFWILPVEVLGTLPSTISLGALKRAMCWRQNSSSSSVVAVALLVLGIRTLRAKAAD